MSQTILPEGEHTNKRKQSLCLIIIFVAVAVGLRMEVSICWLSFHPSVCQAKTLFYKVQVVPCLSVVCLNIHSLASLIYTKSKVQIYLPD